MTDQTNPKVSAPVTGAPKKDPAAEFADAERRHRQALAAWQEEEETKQKQREEAERQAAAKKQQEAAYKTWQKEEEAALAKARAANAAKPRTARKSQAELGVPAGADWLDEAAKFVGNEPGVATWDQTLGQAWYDGTAWHFEERDARNQPLPSTMEEAEQMGFNQYPSWQNKAHDNEIGKSEIKFGHSDGREVIFDGDTGQVVDDPKLRGTYNYASPTVGPVDPDWWDQMKLYFDEWEHGLKDVAPWWALGNDR
ncbi:hypothetical protein [Magnetospira sp. QH-2]|uniref:hypothetical protein n=1 Tax=Magnetospira sp. (strain QH-2) TaxID=1288970 RepID=UPI0003E816F4|nr:hypothetical protein [Magnetospira sp. QH-2]CCQ72020.1 protein of unknown function [Magnetospira sp. QH-2]